MKRIITFVLCATIIFSSFSTWFAIHEYIRLPMLLLGIAIILAGIYSPSSLFCFEPRTKQLREILGIYIILVLCSFVINFLVNPTSKIMSNGAATILIYITFFYLYWSLSYKYLSSRIMLKSLAVGGLVLMTTIAADSMLVNFVGIEIHDWFCFATHGNAGYFIRNGWYSGAAPTEEPGVSSMSLNILAPFSILYFKRLRAHMIILYIYCLFSLCSTTGFVSAILGGCLLLFSPNIKWRTKIMVLGGTMLSITIIISILSFTNISDFLDGIGFLDKISYSGNTVSDMERQEGLNAVYKDWQDAPIIGQGPGFGKVRFDVGYLSTFQANFAMYGTIAGCLFVTFWLLHFFRCFKLDKDIRDVFIFSFFSTLIVGLIGDQLHCFIFYVLYPIINKFYNEQKTIHMLK